MSSLTSLILATSRRGTGSHFVLNSSTTSGSLISGQNRVFSTLFTNLPSSSSSSEEQTNTKNQCCHHRHPCVLLQTREKHSKRQIKRLFKNNIALKRILNRQEREKQGNNNNIMDTATTASSTFAENEPPVNEQPLFPPIYKPDNILGVSGWSPPPEEDSSSSTFERPNYPFSLERTKGKPNNAAGFLPIYTEYKLGGAYQSTVVRKVKGDLEVFLNEMRIHLGLAPKEFSDMVKIRASGTTVEIKGIHTKEIRSWLVGLGF